MTQQSLLSFVLKGSAELQSQDVSTPINFLKKRIPNSRLSSTYEVDTKHLSNEDVAS